MRSISGLRPIGARCRTSPVWATILSRRPTNSSRRSGPVETLPPSSDMWESGCREQGGQMTAAARTLRPPSRTLLLLEGRAVQELGAFLLLRPWLAAAPRGDGHPVLVFP